MPNKKTTKSKPTSKKSTRKNTVTKTTIKKKTTATKKPTSKKIVKTEDVKVTKTPKKTTPKKQPVTVTKKVVKETPVIVKETNVETKKVRRKSHAKRIARGKSNDFVAKLSKLHRKIKIYGIQSVIPKHQIAVILCILVLLAGAIYGFNRLNFNKSKVDLDNVASEIDQLKTVKFNFSEVEKIIKNSKAYTGTPKKYYEYDYKRTFNIERSWLKESAFYYNKSKREIFIVIKPYEEYRNNVTSSIQQFLKQNKITNYETIEYDGYIFYIKSTDNTSVISKVKQTQVRVFDILEEYNKDDVNNVYGIEQSLYKEYKIKKSMLKTDTTEYVIIKPKTDEDKEQIIEKMNAYYTSLEAKWIEDNNEDNLLLVKNRYFEIYEDYLVYIVSRDNELVMHLIEK